MFVFFLRLWLPCQNEYLYISKMSLGINCLCRVCFYGFILAGMLLSVHKDLQLELQLLYYYALFISI